VPLSVSAASSRSAVVSAPACVASATRSTISAVERGEPLGPTITRSCGTRIGIRPVLLRNTPMPPAAATATSTPLARPWSSVSLAFAAAMIAARSAGSL
jgi:hypothetical protein